MTVSEPQPSLVPLRPSVRFMLSHPAHFMALGFGAGLAPKAPGTVGTLWAWLAYLVLQQWLNRSVEWVRRHLPASAEGMKQASRPGA